jgi:hypothetical protein
MSGALLLQNPDGADFQSRAVLEMVRYYLGDGIESSWNKEFHKYDAEPRVTRFDNCREQGYVVFMRDRLRRNQINIAFYEHRNSDSIYVQVNRNETFNAPTLGDITESMGNKWESAFSAGVGEVSKVAEFIVETLTEFWDETKSVVPEVVLRYRGRQAPVVAVAVAEESQS